jgi:chromosome segregation ATPase
VAHGVFVLRRELKSLDDRSESLERRLRDVNHHEDQRLREANSDAERGRIRKELDEERYKIRGDLAATDRSLHRKREELRSAEFDLNNLR